MENMEIKIIKKVNNILHRYQIFIRYLIKWETIKIIESYK